MGDIYHAGEVYAGSVPIDDTQASEDTVYSSAKTEAMIKKAKQNGTTLASLNSAIAGLSTEQKYFAVLKVNGEIMRQIEPFYWSTGCFIGGSSIGEYSLSGVGFYHRVYTYNSSTSTSTEQTVTSWELTYPQ